MHLQILRVPLRIRLLCLFKAEDAVAGCSDIMVKAAAHRGQNGHAQGGGVGHQGEGAGQAIDIGKHLPQQGAFRSAAAQRHFIHADAHIGKNVLAVLHGVAHAFHDGPGQMRPGVHGAEAHESAAAVRVQVRRTLAHQVGGIDQAVSTDTDGSRVPVDLRVFPVLGIEIVAEPLQRQA